MTAASSSGRCPRCNEPATGKFCGSCGTSLQDAKCESCGDRAPAGVRFCPNCGASVAAGAGPAAAGGDRMARLIGGAAVLGLLAFVAGIVVARRSSSPQLAAGSAAGTADAPMVALAGSSTATDISSMSPTERASRLFNRVMSYSERGLTDSAKFFAPMAIQAYEMIGPLDAHARYDIGELSLAVGDGATARAAADTILAARPNHLLGLALAIRAATLTGDKVAASRFTKRLVSAAPAERATGLPEYTEHARDIDDALKKAGGR